MQKVNIDKSELGANLELNKDAATNLIAICHFYTSSKEENDLASKTMELAERLVKALNECLDYKKENAGKWRCDGCDHITKRLKIHWDMCNGEKIGMLNYCCPKCPSNKLTFQGTTKEYEVYWRAEWLGNFDK